MYEPLTTRSNTVDESQIVCTILEQFEDPEAARFVIECTRVRLPSGHRGSWSTTRRTREQADRYVDAILTGNSDDLQHSHHPDDVAAGNLPTDTERAQGGDDDPAAGRASDLIFDGIGLRARGGLVYFG